MDVRDTQERVKQRRMTKERNLKIEKKTFSILQGEDTEPLQEEEELSQIVKTDKDENKIHEGKERVRI